jgi:hypothetical protein
MTLSQNNLNLIELCALTEARVPICISTLWVRASDCQCQSRNSPGFNPSSILRHIGIWEAADGAGLNNFLKSFELNTCILDTANSEGRHVKQFE